jgi:hypothetical protein
LSRGASISGHLLASLAYRWLGDQARRHLRAPERIPWFGEPRTVPGAHWPGVLIFGDAHHRRLFDPKGPHDLVAAPLDLRLLPRVLAVQEVLGGAIEGEHERTLEGGPI